MMDASRLLMKRLATEREAGQFSFRLSAGSACSQGSMGRTLCAEGRGEPPCPFCEMRGDAGLPPAWIDTWEVDEKERC